MSIEEFKNEALELVVESVAKEVGCSTGDVITELWDINLVESLNTEKYEAVPIREHLASLNAPEESAPCLASPK